MSLESWPPPYNCSIWGPPCKGKGWLFPGKSGVTGKLPAEFLMFNSWQATCACLSQDGGWWGKNPRGDEPASWELHGKQCFQPLLTARAAGLGAWGLLKRCFETKRPRCLFFYASNLKKHAPFVAPFPPFLKHKHHSGFRKLACVF